MLVASAFLLLVGLAVLFLLYQKKQLQFIIEKRELSNQFQKELLKTKMETQEETLSHVSKELHDNIGQLLSSSKLLIASVDSSSPSKTLKVADKTLAKAITELRTLSKSLTTDWLKKFNLIENLKAEIARIDRIHHLQISFTHPDRILIPSEKQIILFRMIQQILQNAIKQVGSPTISIYIEQTEELISVEVQDNGKGFNEIETKPDTCIINIRHRSQVLGGTAQWKTNEKGTIVCIQLPTHAA